MDPTRIHPDIEQFASSTHPSSSEEAREFFQERLALFGRIGLFFTAAFLLLANTATVATGVRTLRGVFTDPSNFVSLGTVALSAAVWLGCRRGRRPPGMLKAIDLLAVVLYCSMLAVATWLDRGDPSAPLVALLPVTFAVIARAVIVPSSAARTAWISVLCCLPLFLVTALVWSRPEMSWIEGQCPPSTALFALRGLVGVAMAAVISRVIYGLRHEVRQARQLGQYRLEEKLGEGSMGEVYRGRHAMLRRPTAIKLLSSERAGEKSIARFEREVQLTSRLTHPNTIAIFDYGRTPDGVFYYAMEYLEGMNLQELVREHGSQPPARTIHILAQVCASLSEAHSFGLIHRDIKPANVILCERGGIHDFIKVVDFGLVKHVDTEEDAAISAVNTIAGTPLYMAPESIRDPQAVDRRSDIYAVGAVGYYLLAARPIFESENYMEVCSLQLTREPEPPSVRRGAPLPRDLETLVLRCLRKEPQQRPPSVEELRASLLACEDAGRWDEEAATEWWRRHGRSRRASADPRALAETRLTESDERAAELPTVEIDLERRPGR